MFSADFKGTGAFIRKCYDELATELGLTSEEVKKRCVKYVDAVTKGLVQLKVDLQSGTTKLPIPAVHKLCIFRWLWPHSKKYEKDIMETVVFDDYMERACLVEVNRCIQEKKDATAAIETLKKVRDLTAANAMKKLNLNCAQECILDAADCCVDSSALCDIDNFEDSIESTTSSICAYLPPSKDPTYQYAEAGYVLSEDVSISADAEGGKGVRKRSDGMFSSLKSSGVASLKCGQAVRNAHNAQQVYYDATASLIGHSQLPFCDDKDEHAMVQLNVAVLRAVQMYRDSVQVAVTAAQEYVDEYSSLCESAKQFSATAVTANRKAKIIADTEHLRHLRDKSKRFSSDGWICVLLAQL